jgi:drug/metabolite transporter (DMT)-like permease
MTFSSKQVGAASGVLAAFLWSTTYISGRALLKDGGVIDPWSLSAVRLAIGGIIIFLAAYFIDRKRLFGFSPKQLVMLAVFSLFAYVGMSFFLFKGQQYSNAVNSALIFAIFPVVASFLIDFKKGKITRRRSFGLSLATCGCLLVIGIIGINGFNYSAANIKGDFFTTLSALCWVIGAVIGGKVIKTDDSFAATAWTLLFGALTMLAGMLFQLHGNIVPNDVGNWAIILYIGLMPTGVAFLAWSIALSRISLTLLNTIQYLSPGFTIVLAFIFLREQITLLNVMGICLITLGLVTMEINYIPLRKRKTFCTVKRNQDDNITN